MRIHAVARGTNTGPIAAVTARFRAGPTSADIANARALLAPLCDWAIAAVRFPMGALWGDTDATTLLANAQTMHLRAGAPLADGWRTGRPASADDVAVQVAILQGGMFVAQLLQQCLGALPADVQPSLSTMLIDDMRGGTRNAYHDHPIAHWHEDDIWMRAIVHVSGTEAGTQYIAGDAIEQLQVGEMLIFSGQQRQGVASTLHAAPHTHQPRRLVRYDFDMTARPRLPRKVITIHSG